MLEFEVTVETVVREVYAVSAVDRAEAIENYPDGVLLQSDCQEVLGVLSVYDVTEA